MLYPSKSVVPKLFTRVRGIFADPIPYEVRNPDGDWTPFYGKWFNQRPAGLDLNICWNVAATEIMETQLQFLKATNRFSDDAIAWFKANGYIDVDGDFFLSRRFIVTISGVGTKGNDEAEAWRLAEKYGCIPDAMLPFIDNTSYFDKTHITQAMYDLGKEFLKRVSIAHEELGKRFTRRSDTEMRAAQQQAPLQLGVPVPKIVARWNSEIVQWDGSMNAAHSVECRKINDDGTKPIFDSYNPPMKELSSDYYIPIITRGILNPITVAKPNPVNQEALYPSIWQAVWNWFVSVEWARS